MYKLSENGNSWSYLAGFFGCPTELQKQVESRLII